ncbi:hypothetical protein QQX98_011664 [Neonectria punicea]|uniref:NACHT domain-containing protein n=1 Tax=Neonectria punicea TaxID=979145 RepID=A0ABR1GLD0_9HYPO
MAEAIGLAASIIAVVDLSLKVTSKCKDIIETAKEAPRDLRTILVEISSLRSTLENLQFLAQYDSEFDEAVGNRQDMHDAVAGCKRTLEDLVDELGSLAITDDADVTPSRRQKLKDVVAWMFRESAAKKLLSDILQFKSTITLGLVGQTARDINQVKPVVHNVQETLTRTEQREICYWLEKSNPTEIHNYACRLYEHHTGSWMLRMKDWKSWLNNESRYIRFLWIYGIPGAGKTVLASFLIQSCQEYCSDTGKEGVACVYYYSYRNKQDEGVSLLSWLVSQLCRKLNWIPQNLAINHHLNSLPTMDDLKSALAALLDQMETVHFVVDAVDESLPRDNLLSLLEDLIIDPRFNKVRLLATSRRYSDIESVLRRYSVSISMSNAEVEKDIRTYVDSELNKRFTGWRVALKGEVLEALVQERRECQYLSPVLRVRCYSRR